MRNGVFFRLGTLALVIAAAGLSGELSAQITAGSHTVDPHVQTLSQEPFSADGDVVPLAEIRARCGDGDGCRVRLTVADNFSATVREMRIKMLSVGSIGATYRIFSAAGAFEESGSTDDATTNTIASVLGDRALCEFRDNGPTNDYRLAAFVVFSGDPETCVLRIED